MAQSLVLDKLLTHKLSMENDLKSIPDFYTIAELEDIETSHRAPPNITFNYKLLKHLVTKPEKTTAECRLLVDQLRFFNFPRLIKESIPEFNEEKLLELAKYLKLERHPTNTPLYSENEFCNARMYLLLSGEVTLTKKKDDPVTKMILSARPPSTLAHKLEKISYMPPSPKKKVNPKDLYKLHASLVRSNSLKKTQLELIKTKVNDNRGGLEALENQGSGSLSPGKYEGELDSNEGESDDRLSPKFKKMISLKKVSLQGRNTDHVNVERKLPGGYFGEEIILGLNKRRQAAFVSAPSEIIVVKVEDIRHVENIFENKIIEVYNFLKEVIPSAEKLEYPDVKRNIIPYLVDKKFDKGHVLCEEGTSSNQFFILREGECQCYKNYFSEIEHQKSVQHGLETLFHNEKKVEQVPLYNLNRPCLIAEEILFNEDGKYESSFKVVSQSASFYVIEKGKYFGHFPEEVVKGMKKFVKHKNLSNKRLIKEKFHLIEETFPKKHILSETTQPSEQQYLSPRISQNHNQQRKFTPVARTSNDEKILEIQAFHSPHAHPYLNALSPEILTLSDKFKEYSHTKWARNSALNSSVQPRNATAQLLEEFQTNSTETKETRNNTEKRDTDTKVTIYDTDAKIVENIRLSAKARIEKEKFFSTANEKQKHSRSLSHSNQASQFKSPRTEPTLLSPKTVNPPKVSQQLSLIQHQTEKLIANPKVLATFFNKKTLESPFAQKVKFFSKPAPMDQLKNYFLDTRASNIQSVTHRAESQHHTGANTSMKSTGTFFHTGRKVQSPQRHALRMNVIQGVFY